MVSAAEAECTRASYIMNVLTMDDVDSLVTACAPALSSPAVAIDFCDTIISLCNNYRCGQGNRAVLGAGGVIPAVVAAMATHGVEDSKLALIGCDALGWLACSVGANASAIVICAGGLHAIYAAMAAHALDREVQKKGCWALYTVTANASRSLLAATPKGCDRAVQLLKTAKRNFRSDWNVNFFADSALVVLSSADQL